MQSPSSCGRKVTDAVIWRKIDWISSWISFSVFSGAGSGAVAADLVPGLASARSLFGSYGARQYSLCCVLALHGLG